MRVTFIASKRILDNIGDAIADSLLGYELADRLDPLTASMCSATTGGSAVFSGLVMSAGSCRSVAGHAAGFYFLPSCWGSVKGDLLLDSPPGETSDWAAGLDIDDRRFPPVARAPER
jgi:hypothetical protein